MGSMQLESGPAIEKNTEPFKPEDADQLRREKEEARNKPVDPQLAELKRTLREALRSGMADGSEVILNAGNRVIAGNLSSQIVDVGNNRFAIAVGNPKMGKCGIALLPSGFDPAKTDDPQAQQQFHEAYINAYKQTQSLKIDDTSTLKIGDGRNPAAGLQPIHPRRTTLDPVSVGAPDKSTTIHSSLIVTNPSSLTLLTSAPGAPEAGVKSYNFHVSPFGSVALVENGKMIQVPGLNLRGILPRDSANRALLQDFLSTGNNGQELQQRLSEFVFKRQR